MYLTLFLVRRLLFALIALYSTEFFVGQILVLVMCSLIMIYSIVGTKPFQSTSNNRFQLLNEAVIFDSIGLLILFNVLSENEAASGVVGYLYLILIIIVCAYSLAFIIYSAISDTRNLLKKRQQRFQNLQMAALKEAHSMGEYQDIIAHIDSRDVSEPPKQVLYWEDEESRKRSNSRAQEYDTIDHTINEIDLRHD